MRALFASGLLIELIIVGMTLEGLVLFLYHRRTGRGIAPIAFLPNLLAGMNILFAMDAFVTGRSWVWISFHLLLALIFHVIDLRRLWRG